MSSLPERVQLVFCTVFADATANVLRIVAPFSFVALVAIAFVREVPLRTALERADELEVARPVSAAATS